MRRVNGEWRGVKVGMRHGTQGHAGAIGVTHGGVGCGPLRMTQQCWRTSSKEADALLALPAYCAGASHAVVAPALIALPSASSSGADVAAGAPVALATRSST